MDEFQLPADFLNFLSGDRLLDFSEKYCHLGKITWNNKEVLQRETFLFQSYGSDLEKIDPQGTDGGFYLVPAISLIAETSNYPPHFLFSWLPTENCFASGDEEHGHLWIFPNVSWQEITANPIPYLEAQWDGSDGVGQLLCPWPKYPHVDSWSGE